MSAIQRAKLLADVSRWLSNFNALENSIDDHIPYQFERFSAKIRYTRPGKKRAVRAALAAREVLNLGAGEPVYVCQCLESAGIKICQLDLGSDEIFGMSIAPRDGGPAIVVNTWNRIPLERRRFTIAHELGHLLLHLNHNLFKVEEAGSDDLFEEESDWFATYFLVTDEDLFKKWEETKPTVAERDYAEAVLVERVRRIKHHFGVSYKLVLKRLVAGEIVGDDIWRQFGTSYEYLYGHTLSKFEEADALPTDTVDYSSRRSLSVHAGFNGLHQFAADLALSRPSRLVRLGIDKKLITTEEGAAILSLASSPIRERVSDNSNIDSTGFADASEHWLSPKEFSLEEIDGTLRVYAME